jgi:hypothetical protein
MIEIQLRPLNSELSTNVQELENLILQRASDFIGYGLK